MKASQVCSYLLPCTFIPADTTLTKKTRAVPMANGCEANSRKTLLNALRLVFQLAKLKGQNVFKAFWRLLANIVTRWTRRPLYRPQTKPTVHPLTTEQPGGQFICYSEAFHRDASSYIPTSISQVIPYSLSVGPTSQLDVASIHSITSRHSASSMHIPMRPVSVYSQNRVDAASASQRATHDITRGTGYDGAATSSPNTTQSDTLPCSGNSGDAGEGSSTAVSVSSEDKGLTLYPLISTEVKRYERGVSMCV